jgi:2-polyprenyl-3-methyl-5-hydroxy-6-metoxy-1,4-benzoquinol methylase
MTSRRRDQRSAISTNIPTNTTASILGDGEDISFYLSLSGGLEPRNVLELGCGTGRITLPWAQLGFDVVGLDHQPEMLQKAEERRR